jgi:hypothetical protein
LQASVILQRVIIALILATAVLYAGDYSWVRYKTSGANSAAAMGSVEIHRVWELPRKDGRVEFTWDPPESETCVHSIFPHFGYVPCWYAVRHTTIHAAQ